MKNSERYYKRFWLFALWFTAFWILYGCVVFVKNFIINDRFDMQPIYLMIGMLILFVTSRSEYRKVEKTSEVNKP